MCALWLVLTFLDFILVTLTRVEEYALVMLSALRGGAIQVVLTLCCRIVDPFPIISLGVRAVDPRA